MDTEQVQKLLPDIISHLVVNIAPQEQQPSSSEEIVKCPHEYTVTWTDLLDLVIASHNTTCGHQQQRSLKDIHVTITLDNADYDALPVPDDDRSNNPGEYVDVSFACGGQILRQLLARSTGG